MTSYKSLLLEVEPNACDWSVACLIAHAALEIERVPYCFSIDHNIGAPKFNACPLKYDFTYGKTVGINTRDRTTAAKWIEDAILHGYTVTRAGHHTPGIKDREPYGDAWSLVRVRERAARHQNPPLETDDDIPF